MDLISRKAFPSINELREMRCIKENQYDKSWSAHENHFFIITNTSRPVYFRYGDDEVIMPLLCSTLMLLARCDEWNQKLQVINAGDKVFVFYAPSSIIYICVSSRKLPISLIMHQLECLENVLFSLLSPYIMNILNNSSNSRRSIDIKRQIGGSERLFTSMLYESENYLSFIFHDCIPMAAITQDRAEFSKILFENKYQSCLAIILFYYGNVVCIVEKESFKLTASDIRILANNTYPSSESLDNSWSPIWLPNHTENLQILTVDISSFDFKMILIGDQIEDYTELVLIAENIVKRMNENDLKSKLIPIKQFSEVKTYVVVDKNLLQVYSPYVEVNDESKDIYETVAWVSEFLKKGTINGEFYLATEKFTIIGNNTVNETIIGVMDIGVTPSEAKFVLNNLLEFCDKFRNIFFDSRPKKWIS